MKIKAPLNPQYLKEQKQCFKFLFNKSTITRQDFLSNMVEYSDHVKGEEATFIDIVSGINKGKSYSYKQIYNEMLSHGLINPRLKIIFGNSTALAPEMFIFELQQANRMYESGLFESVTLHVAKPNFSNISHTRQENPDFTVILKVNTSPKLEHNFDSKSGALSYSGESHIFSPRINCNSSEFICDSILNTPTSSKKYLSEVQVNALKNLQNLIQRSDNRSALKKEFENLLNFQIEDLDSFDRLNSIRVNILNLRPKCRWNPDLVFPNLQKLAVEPLTDLMISKYDKTWINNNLDRKRLHNDHINFESPELRDSISSWDKNFLDQIK